MGSNDLITKHNKISSVHQLKRVMFFVGFTLSLLQQMPIIKDILYSELRIVLYSIFAIFGFLSLLSLTSILKVKFNLYFFLVLLYSFFIFLITFVAADNTFNFFEMLIPFIVLICSFGTKYSEKQLNIILFWYVLLSAFLGLSSIFYYGEGIFITEQYFLEGKNQIGPMLAYATFIVGFWIINYMNKNKVTAFFYYLLCMPLLVSLLISILVIRNRSGVITLVITFSILLIKKAKLKFTAFQFFIITLLLSTVTILFIQGAFNGMVEFATKSLFSNYEVTNLNSLSAGRTGVYIEALNFTKEYPILGELGSTDFLYGTPHNYILNKWVTLGAAISLPFIVFYLYLWKFVGQVLVKKNTNMLATLPIWILFLSLIISLFEYTYPYGPGVSQMIVWFLIGQYSRKVKWTLEN